MALITPNEATITGAVLGAILGAVFGCIASLLTARYTIKPGANYGAQISDIHKTLDSLAKTQADLKLQQAQALEQENERHQVQEKKAEAARWKPNALINSSVQGTEQVNTLRLESPQEFAITEASLVSTSGAKLHDFPVNEPKVFSTGHSVPIVHKSLLMISNNSQSYFQTNSFQGGIRYKALREDGTEYDVKSGSMPKQHLSQTLFGSSFRASTVALGDSALSNEALQHLTRYSQHTVAPFESAFTAAKVNYPSTLLKPPNNTVGADS